MSDKTAESLKKRDELVAMLKGSNRRQRQDAAHVLSMMAIKHSDVVQEVGDELSKALELPEAQTRWECLDALSTVIVEYPDCAPGAFDGAEEALFDEGSALVRLAAFRFLTRFGALDASSSQRAWPLLREAIQCYHGDPEYREMLICLLDFARGNIAPEVAEDLADRVRFDAKSGSGFYKAYSTEICSIIKKA